MIKKLLQALVIGFCSTVFVLFLDSFKLLDQWEYSTWSWRVRELAKPSPSTDKIKLILLDQSSLDWGAKENGLSWPWPREVYAPILAFCKRGGAKVVAFDVLYTEPSIYGMEDDEYFAQSIAENPVVLPLFLGKQTQQNLQWPQSISRNTITIKGLSNWQEQQVMEETHAAFPVPNLANAAKILGRVDEKPDDDGIFRRVSLIRSFDNEAIPSLGLAAYLLGMPDTSVSIDEQYFYLADKAFEISASGQAILKFRGPSRTHGAFSAAAIIQSELSLEAGEPSVIDPNEFKDKYVFLGFSAPGLRDLKPTPINNDYPGVEIHATLLDNLLQHDTIKLTPSWFSIVVIFILASLSNLILSLRKKASQIIFYYALFIGVTVGLACVAYLQGYWWPMAQSILAVAIVLIGSVILNYAIEGRQKRFIKSAFKQYLSADVIEQLLNNPDFLTLGGEKRELSIFFSDIEGFTTLSEKLDAVELVNFLNDYLSDLTDIIMEEGGTLDKYEGDAIIAFWNAPIAQPDHAIRICRTALRCQQKLAERRDEYFQRTGVLIYNRIGIHTGDVVVGNIGSKNRFDYTIIGDAANLASRLEGANKPFGTYLMVSEATWTQTQGAFIGREIAVLRVVGRKNPVTVYELLGFKGQSLSEDVLRYNEALALYKKAQWEDALAIFSLLADDALSQAYARRCEALAKDNASIDDVIWNLRHK